MSGRNLTPLLLFVALGSSPACAKAPAKHQLAASAPRADASPDRTPPADAEHTPSGLRSKVLKPGHGIERPERHDSVRVHFTGWNEKGKLIDSSAKRGGPVTFQLTGVIAGLAEGLQRMQIGEQRRMWMPDELVYPGRPGYPRGISVYDVELLEILDGIPPQPAPPDVAAVPRDATTTASGLAYKLLAKGSGRERPKPWDRVALHFTGWTADGAMFETSRSRERPSLFDLAKVMPGWREALPLLSVGDHARVWIPEALAYRGRAGEPKGNVVFDIELVSIERLPEPPRAPAQVAAAPRDAHKTHSGLAYRFLRKGGGTTKPTANDHVEVQYSAWTRDGALFDSSVVRGKPAKVPVRNVIPGWAEGLQLMAQGDKALFWIPEPLAYGGQAGAPKGMLVYEVELLSVVR